MRNISTCYKVAAELPSLMVKPNAYFCTKTISGKHFPVINAYHFYMLLGGSWTAIPYGITLHLFSY